MNSATILTSILLFSIPALAGEHPRILITAADLPRIRHVVGTGSAGDASLGPFGRRAADLNALREHFATTPTDSAAALVLPGETLAAAALSLMVDDPAFSDRLNGHVRRALETPSVFADEWLERIIALDWAWDRIDSQTRANFIAALRQRIQPFEASDSPTNHTAFRERLVGLAGVVAFDETDDATSGWRETRKRVLDAAKSYFADVFPAYLKARGRVPTSPGSAAAEESDIVLAIELASALPGGPQWVDSPAARLLEHYIVAGTQHPALQSQFLRDDARVAAPTPASTWESMLPLTANLLAVRTRDPAAAAVARRVERSIAEAGDRLLAAPWRWVPIVFDPHGIPQVDVADLPAARNLDGAVVFRGGREPLSRIIWIDAGQRLLNSSQAFDAGGFLIRNGGELAVSASDSLWQLAVPDRQGVQRLGASTDAFDYAQFASATIAHNCLIVFEATRMARWRGRVWSAIGGQKPVDGDCRDYATPVESQGRAPSTLTAYGSEDRSAYAAVDLSAAYDDRNLKKYSREFLWLGGVALLVVDRVELNDPRARPTWILNLPARPTVNGQELPRERREAGADNSGGIWRFTSEQLEPPAASADGDTPAGEGIPRAGWIRSHDRDGALWVASILPRDSVIALVGGPARAEPTSILEPRPITYVGGSAESFEHRILPSRQPRNENAWYRVRDLPSFAANYARGPHWGRLEIESRDNPAEQLFVTLLIPTDVGARAPQATTTLADETLSLSVRVGDRKVGAKLLLGVRRSDPPTISDGEKSWTPRLEVRPDSPLPTASAAKP